MYDSLSSMNLTWRLTCSAEMGKRPEGDGNDSACLESEALLKVCNVGV